jgi:hypothetical protein
MKKCFSSPQILKKIIRLSSIFFAIGTFSYSNVSHADVQGIPNNPDFPNAQYPYAQAPDGCSGWQNTRQVRDTWGSVNFTEACNNHDRCYYTRGSNWNTCNERFYSDLRAACERDLRVWVPPVTVRGVVITPGFHTPPEPASLSACYTVASGYYAGVQAGVLLDVFNEAQDKQRRYEAWVATIRSPKPSNSREDQYLVGDWDGDRRSNLAVRRGNKILMDFNFDGSHDQEQGYGSGNSESQYLVGDWDGDGKDNIAVRRGNCVLMDFNFDGSHDREQCYGNGNSESQYLVGDWNGDGKDNIAVRRGNKILMDFNFDGSHDQEQGYGSGNSESQYLVGDWDGDGKDNIAVRRGNCVLMDFNFDGSHNREQCYGNGNSESQYLVGDWDGDGKDNIAVRRGNRILMDFNFDGSHDQEQGYGNG